MTKRNNVQYEGKISLKIISLCTLIHVFEQLSSNEVSGIRLNSQRTVVTAIEVAVYMSVEFGLAGGGAEHVEDWLECFRTKCSAVTAGNKITLQT